MTPFKDRLARAKELAGKALPYENTQKMFANGSPEFNEKWRHQIAYENALCPSFTLDLIARYERLLKCVEGMSQLKGTKSIPLEQWPRSYLEECIVLDTKNALEALRADDEAGK